MSVERPRSPVLNQPEAFCWLFASQRQVSPPNACSALQPSPTLVPWVLPRKPAATAAVASQCCVLHLHSPFPTVFVRSTGQWNKNAIVADKTSLEEEKGWEVGEGNMQVGEGKRQTKWEKK
jgi:hypothetical protein